MKSNNMELYESIAESLWSELFPRIEEAAISLSMNTQIVRNDEIISIEIESLKTGNTFYFNTGYEDEFGTSYSRFLGVITPINNTKQAINALINCSPFGASIYIDNKLFEPESVLMLKFDFPLIGGVPDSSWYEWILMIFDSRLKLMKDELKIEN